MTAPRLLIVAPAPVIETPTGVVLDIKFYEGMRQHCDLWPGQVTCLLRRGAQDIVFKVEKPRDQLPFNLRIIDPEQTIDAETLTEQDIVMCSADDHTNLHISALARAAGIKSVYVIEYILETRLQINWLDTSRSLPRRLRSILWNYSQERRRKKAIRLADALQSNGYPADTAYKALAADSMVYLDNRMTADLYCDAENMANRAARLQSDAPLRLLFSGRLDPMKGAQDLVPVAAGLRAKGIPFTLDIFGTGILEDTLRAQIDETGLQDQVTLHAPVDFATELVPWASENADIYLCCHKQSDPSCTYLENMGCGLAVVGYGNRMWSDLCARSKAGWAVHLGDVGALVACLAERSKDRQSIIKASENALTFARQHDFHAEFAKRMDHVRSLI